MQSTKYSDRTLSILLLSQLLQRHSLLPPAGVETLWSLLLQAKSDKVANVRVRLSRSLNELPLDLLVGRKQVSCTEVLGLLLVDTDRDVRHFALQAASRVGMGVNTSTTTTTASSAPAAGISIGSNEEMMMQM